MIKYTYDQYQQALSIVNTFESDPESISITTKITGNGVKLIEDTKRYYPKLNKSQIVNKLMNELYELKQKK